LVHNHFFSDLDGSGFVEKKSEGMINLIKIYQKEKLLLTKEFVGCLPPEVQVYAKS